MAFTDLIFLFLFFPISLTIYYLCNQTIRIYVLVAISLFFYACASPDFFLLLIFSLIFNVFIGKIMIRYEKQKFIAISLFLMGLIYNIGLLLYYKYFNFIALNLNKINIQLFTPRHLVLPLGLSFFVFKSISYLVDVYTGKNRDNNNTVHAMLYLTFFAQVQSGPLSRYNDMVTHSVPPQQNYSESIINNLTEGTYRFIIGFNKKILLANTLANIAQETFTADSLNMSVAFAWLGAICYSLQLFFDFSGYSDMAIGISKMFGFKCPENFNYPYMTASISEFWHRWHITLGAWFRDYVYIPLGGSRVKSKLRLNINLLIVWLLTSIWHGANWNFLIWGLSYFAVISFEKMTDWPKRIKSHLIKSLYRIVTLLFIIFQWVIFRSSDLNRGFKYIKSMIFCPTNPLADSRTIFLLKDYCIFIIVGVLLCFPIVPTLEKWIHEKNVKYIYDILLVVANSLLFLCAISFVVAGQNNPFVYANF